MPRARSQSRARSDRGAPVRHAFLGHRLDVDVVLDRLVVAVEEPAAPRLRSRPPTATCAARTAGSPRTSARAASGSRNDPRTSWRSLSAVRRSTPAIGRTRGNGASSRFSAPGSAPSTPSRFAVNGIAIVTTKSSAAGVDRTRCGVPSLRSASAGRGVGWPEDAGTFDSRESSEAEIDERVVGPRRHAHDRQHQQRRSAPRCSSSGSVQPRPSSIARGQRRHPAAPIRSRRRASASINSGVRYQPTV